MKKSKAREILGVSPSSSNDDIKRSFRNLCHLVHPDTGGNREDFENLKIAYKRLISPYEARPDYGRAISELVSAFEIVFSQIKSPTQVDIINRVKAEILKGISGIEQTNLVIKANEKKLITILSRLSCKDPNPVVINIFNDHLDEAEELLATNSEKIECLKLALQLADSYSYDFDKQDNVFGGMTYVYS